MSHANYFMCRHETAIYIHTSYELTAVNNVTWNTGIHAFHITCICHLSKYACHIIHICPTAPLYTTYRPPFTAHFNHKSINCNIYFPCYPKICTSKATYIPYFQINGGKYANTYATYEVTGINHVTRSAVNRQQNWQRCRHKTLRPMEPNYISRVGCWQNQPKTTLSLQLSQWSQNKLTDTFCTFLWCIPFQN